MSEGFSAALQHWLGAGAQVVGRGTQAVVLRGGPIASGKVLKLFHDAGEAAAELEALAVFGAAGIGPGSGILAGPREVIETDLGEGNPFVSGEPGGPLVFSGYPADPGEIEPGFAGALEARLKGLHARGITHNDVSPKNLVFRRGKHGSRLDPGLVDFGWAQIPGSAHNARMRELDGKIGLDGSPGAYDRLSCRALEAFFALLAARAFVPGQSMRPMLAELLGLQAAQLPFAF